MAYKVISGEIMQNKAEFVLETQANLKCKGTYIFPLSEKLIMKISL